MDDLIYESATKIADRIRKKEVSSVEVINIYFDRINSINPLLNSVVQTCAERALDEAKFADKVISEKRSVGPLHGVPLTLKDSLNTEGIISAAGTTGRSKFIPEKDSTVTSRLRKAGAILLGKTNTPEFTHSAETDNLVYGRTNNPYNIKKMPGGSSGGSAATIAAGGSALDIGSDTRGSIRLPAHFCGVAGIKPNSGRVPRTGHILDYSMGAIESLTQNGPMARYVEDLILTLPIISGADWIDPAIVDMPLGDPGKVKIKDLKIAFYTDNKIKTVSDKEIRDGNGAKLLKDITSTFDSIYLSIDLDVLDPAFAPGVGNPEAVGITSRELYDLITSLQNKNIRAADIVELNPSFDNGSTASFAAKIISTVLAMNNAKQS